MERIDFKYFENLKGRCEGMKQEAILDYYIVNGELQPVENQKIFQEISGPLIYEVIRVVEGTALFFEDHMDRMRKSAELLGYTISTNNKILFNEIQELIRANHYPQLNIKLLLGDLDKKEQKFLLYFVESNYPALEVYQKGIHTILFLSERENPNAKVVDSNLRQRVRESMEKQRAYEVLLINQENYITEGSRSNIFFVRENQLITAPEGDVLLGVTRKRIMEVCKKLGIDVRLELIHRNQLEELQGAFMTGTSVKVLPICSIGEIPYNSVKNNIIERVQQGYEEDVRDYIHKRNVHR